MPYVQSDLIHFSFGKTSVQQVGRVGGGKAGRREGEMVDVI